MQAASGDIGATGATGDRGARGADGVDGPRYLKMPQAMQDALKAAHLGPA